MFQNRDFADANRRTGLRKALTCGTSFEAGSPPGRAAKGRRGIRLACGRRRHSRRSDRLLVDLSHGHDRTAPAGGIKADGLPIFDRRAAVRQSRRRFAAAQLWAERFDVARTDILEVQDEIVGRLARAIGLKVIDVEGRRAERERPKSTDATDLLMRAKVIANRPSSRETMSGARDLYEQALKVEPENIDALAGVATTLVFEVLNGYYQAGNEQRLAEAEELLARTLAVEPRHLVALKASAALRRAQGKFEEGIAAAEAVIGENPGEPWAYKEIGFSTMYLGSPIAALDWFAKADRLGPRDPARWTWLDGQGHALILLGRDEEAVRSLRAALDSNPSAVGTYALLASAYALAGLADKSRLALAQYQKYNPDVTVGSFRSLAPVPLNLTSQKYRQQFERVKEGLRKAGMPG
jgi:adenylate cyclase